MMCEGCGQNSDLLWQAGSDDEGRRIFICEECIREPNHRHAPTGVTIG